MNNRYPFKQAIITGLAVGIFAIVVFTIADALNQYYQWGYNPVMLRGLTGLLTIVILAIGIYVGIRHVKKLNNGDLTYGAALVAGLTVAVISAVITATFSLVYCLANPGHATYMVNQCRRVMLADGKSPAEIDATVASLKIQMTAGVQVFQALVGQAVSGTILSLLIAAFVKTRKK